MNTILRITHFCAYSHEPRQHDPSGVGADSDALRGRKRYALSNDKMVGRYRTSIFGKLTTHYGVRGIRHPSPFRKFSRLKSFGETAYVQRVVCCLMRCLRCSTGSNGLLLKTGRHGMAFILMTLPSDSCKAPSPRPFTLRVLHWNMPALYGYSYEPPDYGSPWFVRPIASLI
ncbi:hypothetical protein BJV78DRAFT_470076 [Lactifluus subvellereus]|nr:hypothetical protein BJV78DRAFT_470076 [Lactifluus subvellereus]